MTTSPHSLSAFEAALARLVEGFQAIPPALKASYLRDAMERLEGRRDRLTTADLISIGRHQTAERRGRLTKP